MSTQEQEVTPGVELGSKTFWLRLEQDPANLAAEVANIDVQQLNETMVRHPALRAWLNATHELAKIDEEKAKWHLTKTRATVMLEAKAINDAHTGKGKTVGVLEAEVDTHANVLTATEKYSAACEKRAVLRAMTDALDDRLQMLIQLSANTRAERDGYNRQ